MCESHTIFDNYAPALPAHKWHSGIEKVPHNVLPFKRLWYGEPNAISNAIGYAKFYSRSHDAVIRVYDDTGNVIEMHEHAGDFQSSLGGFC